MLRTVTVCTLLALLATPASGHGGIYRPPSDAGGPSQANGGKNGPPTNPGGAERAGPGEPGSAGTGLSTRGDTGRRGSQRGGRTSSTGVLDNLGANGVWEFWWEHNKYAFLDLRSRLTGGGATTLSAGPLTGHGRNTHALPTRAVTPDMTANEVIPALVALLAGTDQRDLLDSAVLAMARSAGAGQTDDALAAAQGLLAHPELSVQSSAALSLGVLGSPRAVPLLQDLAVGTSAGRVLVGGRAIPMLVRELAVIALGMLDDSNAVSTLMDIARHTPDNEGNLRACAVVGLGLSHESAGAEAVTLLIGMLGDRKVDPVVKSFVPTALGKLGDPAALPALLDAFTDRDTHVYVTESIAIALGRLGAMDRPEVISALQACHEQAGDVSARQFALMSLARIAAREEVPEDSRPAHDALMSWLLDHVRKPARRTDLPWSALAASIAARNHARWQGPAIDRLGDGYEDASDPSVKGAFALALGLLESHAHGDAILRDLRSVSDAGFRGYAAVALGLIGHEAARDPMRVLCADRTQPPSLRRSLAAGLALMRDRQTVPVLVKLLDHAETLGLVAAVAQSLGMIGDAEALAPIKATLADTGRPPLSRAFAAVSLGLLAERSRLPWHAPIREDNNYLIEIPPMSEIFDIP